MAAADIPELLFLLDVDNTLVDNDALVADLRRQLVQSFGEASAARYWSIFDELRNELGYVDYLGALQRYRKEVVYASAGDQRLLRMSAFLVDYPFASRLYPDALATVAHLGRIGPTVILSDGDVVFQPLKVQRSGLWDAVEGRVLIYVHKEQMLEQVQRLYPARHYVMVDDKLRILAAMKRAMGARLTTVFPRQGHYALDRAETAPHAPADITIGAISELLGFDARSFTPSAFQEKQA